MNNWTPNLGTNGIPVSLFSPWRRIWHSSPYVEEAAPQEPGWLRADGLIIESQGGQFVEISGVVVEHAGIEAHSLGFEMLSAAPNSRTPCDGLDAFKDIKLETLFCLEPRVVASGLQQDLVTSALFYTAAGRCLWIALSGLPEHIKFRTSDQKDQKLLQLLWGYEHRFTSPAG